MSNDKIIICSICSREITSSNIKFIGDQYYCNHCFKELIDDSNYSDQVDLSD